jgi:hypothetical protein
VTEPLTRSQAAEVLAAALLAAALFGRTRPVATSS